MLCVCLHLWVDAHAHQAGRAGHPLDVIGRAGQRLADVLDDLRRIGGIHGAWSQQTTIPSAQDRRDGAVA